MSTGDIFIVTTQTVASNDTYFLFPSWLASIISSLLISSKVITRAEVIPTPIINLFSSKLYIFSPVIRYFSAADANYIKLTSTSKLSPNHIHTSS